MSRCRVIKVGGSLFDLPDLPQRLHQWISHHIGPSDRTVLIAGGGPLCDFIRTADAQFDLGEEAAHWLCIRALHTTAGLLAKILKCEEINTWNGLQQWHAADSPRQVVFDVSQFLIAEEPHLPDGILPHGWQVTTDSIAARVAALLGADELVLIKSADPPDDSREALLESDIVDAHFPIAAAGLAKISVINLRR